LLVTTLPLFLEGYVIMMRASRIVALLTLALVVACAGERPKNLGVHDDRLTPCPEKPNCVSSDASDEEHRVAPLSLEGGDPALAWKAARMAVESLPRTEVIADTGSYLHAECRSMLMGYVDDLELQVRPKQGIIAVRSASRLGYSDMGVNRRRVERLRARMTDPQTPQP
jgi:uncharacterized protein (DUF1499 family)